MNNSEQKSGVRKNMLSKRDLLSVIKKKELDLKICDKLGRLIEQRGDKVIHSYIPMGSEIDITELLQKLLTQNKILICSKSLPKRTMQNFVLTSLEDLNDGRFGTKYPASGIEYNDKIDIFIVPGLAFDGRGYRIGYGAGYYDKYFSLRNSGYKVGICYDFQIIGKVADEPHDVKLDKVIF